MGMRAPIAAARPDRSSSLIWSDCSPAATRPLARALARLAPALALAHLDPGLTGVAGHMDPGAAHLDAVPGRDPLEFLRGLLLGHPQRNPAAVEQDLRAALVERLQRHLA